MNKIEIFPAEQRVVILPEEVQEGRTPSGIIIPKTVDDNKPLIGLVVASGRGSDDHPMEYVPGDIVIISTYSGVEVELNLHDHGIHTYKVVNQMDIMAKIQGID